MRIDLTVRGLDGVDHDVAVCAATPAPFHRVVRALRDVLGVAVCADGWWSGARPLSDDTPLGGPGLRCGDVLTPTGSAAEAGARLAVVGGLDAGRLVAGSRRTIVVGRDAACDLPLRDPAVSRRHAEITFDTVGVSVRDLGSTSGSALDGAAVGPVPMPWAPDALLRIGDSHLARPSTAGPPATADDAADGSVRVRPRRRAVPPPPAVFEGPGATARFTHLPVPWLAAAVPAVAGLGMAALIGSPQFLAFALLSPLTLVVTGVGDRLGRRRQARRSTRADAAATVRLDDRVDEAVRDEITTRRHDQPDPATILRIARGPLARLWERGPDDPDLLRVRIGLGTSPSGVRRGEAPAAVLVGVPATVDLRAGPLGIVAPPDVGMGIARWVVAQLAAFASPADVRIVVAGPREEWLCTRWLPHVDREPPTDSRVDAPPTVVVSVGAGSQSSWWHLPGVTGVCFAESRASLPARCSEVLVAVNESGTRLRRGDDVVRVDCVDAEWADRFARSLAPLVDATAHRQTSLPRVSRLGDLIGELSVESVSARWAHSGGTAEAVLGVAADGPLSVDLERDGPHVLVAGTTGAGKSGLLRALVASLAVGHPPDEIAFLLVDYKGGAAFAECADLPHVVSVVTDLDEQLTRRALASLGAELRRRERLFAAAGAADLAAYRRTPDRSTLPRLVLVVDEFATLAGELPDFVSGLTSIAQRGRSLGLHLVLATQRPAGVVTPAIRANCSLRIALRMTDAGDSRDVIEVPDADAIPADRPGRACVWRGGTVTALQVAGVDEAAADDDPAHVSVLALDANRAMAGRSAAGPTELQHIVAVARAAAALRGADPVPAPWLPALPDRLAPLTIPPSDRAHVPIGLVDLPSEQRQRPLTVELDTGGSVLLVGGPGSGRTTALVALARSAARRLDPDRLHIHAIDTAGDLLRALAGLPHLGTATADPEVTSALLEELVAQARRRRAHVPGDDPSAAIALLVDGWEPFARAMDDWDAGRSSDRLLTLAGGAAGARLTVALTGDRTALSPRVSGAFGWRVLLRLADRTDYAVAGIPGAAVPKRMAPGRGLLTPDGIEVQLALPPAAPAHPAPPARAALRLRPLPLCVRLTELPAPDRLLPFGVAAPLGISTGLPRSTVHFLVAGPARSGRSTVLRVLLHQVLRVGDPVTVVAPPRSPLHRDAVRAALPVVVPAADPSTITGAPGWVLVDDAEAFADTRLDTVLVDRARTAEPGRGLIVAARTEDLALGNRGVAGEVRRSRCGLVLRPGPVDGDLLGVRVRPATPDDPPGRGVFVADPSWGPTFEAAPVRMQVAQP